MYGERNVLVKGPQGKDRKVKVPLQRIGGPLARITSTAIGKRIAGKRRSMLGAAVQMVS